MSYAAKIIIRQWLAKLDAGLFELEDYSITPDELEELRREVAA